MGLRFTFPLMLIGGNPNLSTSIEAPISLKGLTIRFIGLFDKDSSPVSTTSNDCAASNPESSLIDVPEFPR